jgi:hypothetical protein
MLILLVLPSSELAGAVKAHMRSYPVPGPKSGINGGGHWGPGVTRLPLPPMPPQRPWSVSSHPQPPRAAAAAQYSAFDCLHLSAFVVLYADTFLLMHRECVRPPTLGVGTWYYPLSTLLEMGRVLRVVRVIRQTRITTNAYASEWG